MLKLYEDVGSLKALFTSIDGKLDDVRGEFRALREEQVQMKMEVSEIKVTSEAKSEAITRIEESVTSVEKRVDQLVALRHRIGGAMFLVTMTGGVVFSAWDVIAHFVVQLVHTPK
jgi:chromosome segregation ATPase